MQQVWKKLVIAIAVVAFTPLAGWAQDVARTHEITLDDYLTVYLATECATSPDGQYVAYTELRWGEHDEPRTTELWVVNTETKQATRLTFNRISDHSPQWGPDSKHIYFLSKNKRGDKQPPYDGTTQVWVTGVHPGEPFPITRVKGGIESYQLSEDGRTLYYTKAGKEAEQDWKELRGKYSDIEFGTGPVKYTEIWKLDLDGWREEKVVAPERVITDFSVAPDQQRIAMITTPDDRLITKEGRSRVDVFDCATGETATLPDRLYRAEAPSPNGWLENLAWSPDSSMLAFTVDYDGYPGEILITEWVDGAAQVGMLTRPNEIHCAGQLQWLPNSHKLFFLAEDHARRRVHGLEVSPGAIVSAASVLTPGDVVAHAFSFASSGRQAAVIRSDVQHSRDVYFSTADNPAAKWVRLTNVNPQMDTWKLPQISHVTWTAPDGVEVGGILELPPDYTPEQGPLPMVVELHGGPTDCTRLHIRYWIYGRTLLAAKGYALLSPNYRGSTGYGDKFLTDLIGRENDIEIKDILAGVDAMVERGIADPERLGVMGWSNGGFLTNGVITTTQRFKAASSGAGTFDQLMQWGLEDTPGHVVNYMQGLPWERTEAYIKASPAYKLGQVTTPTIIHVGGDDPRVPPAHSISLYRGLKEYTNVPTVLLVYPGAGHGLTISDHRKAKLEWDLAWFDRYLLGKTDEAKQP